MLLYPKYFPAISKDSFANSDQLTRNRKQILTFYPQNKVLITYLHRYIKLENKEMEWNLIVSYMNVHLADVI